jgi:hypothetical protein
MTTPKLAIEIEGEPSPESDAFVFLEQPEILLTKAS